VGDLLRDFRPFAGRVLELASALRIVFATRSRAQRGLLDAKDA
jgi:hypothetical protein